jgi:hypothetical protein
LLLDWHYFWGAVIIIGTMVYLRVILIRIGREAYRLRSAIHADDPLALGEQLRIVIPVPHATEKADPRDIARRDWF